MKEITSSGNSLYKGWQRLARQGGADRQSIVLEGVHLCQAWLARFGQPQWALFRQDDQLDGEVALLAGEVIEANQAWLSPRLMRGLSALVSEPPVMFVVDAPVPALPKQINDSVLVLDAIQDPGNVGTLLRIAAAAGVFNVVAGLGTANCWSAKALRAGQGAQFNLSIYESIDLPVWLDTQLKMGSVEQARPRVLATTLNQTAKPLFELSLSGPLVWLFGHEGRGVSEQLVAMADQSVYIPHETNAVESLNVASAAAICLFEQRRQRLYGAQ